VKRILLIEDDPGIIKLWKSHLRRLPPNAVELVVASTFNEVDTAMNSHAFFDIVVIDGNLEGRQGDTLPLVSKIREVFRGTIVAASGDPRTVKQLMEAASGYSKGTDDKSLSIRIALEELDLLSED